MSDGQNNEPSALALVAGLAAVGGVGYVAYRYWYIPAQMRRDISNYAYRNGIPVQDALAKLGQVGCQAYGAKYGLPPDASGNICGELASAASAVVRQIPSLLGNTLSAAGSGVGAVGQGVGTGVSAIGTGAAQGITALGKVPIDVAGYGLTQAAKGVGSVYGGAKIVVNDVYKGTKTVISDVTRVPVNVVKSVGKETGKAVKSVGKFLGF